MEIFPVGIAAGMIRKAAHIEQGLEHLATSIVFGSFTLGEKEGNPEPAFWFDEDTENSWNAIGLKNDGLPQFLTEELPRIVERFAESECGVGISLAPLQSHDLSIMSEFIANSEYRSHIKRIEINAACPNHRGPHGLHPVIAYDPFAVEILLKEAAPLHGMNVFLKIGPRTSHVILRDLVLLSLMYELTGIVSGNTRLGNAFENGKFVLSVPQGGQAGKVLLPDALNQMIGLRALVKEHDSDHRLTLIGCGGIMNAVALDGYQFAEADETQIATLYYKFGMQGLESLLTQFYGR